MAYLEFTGKRFVQNYHLTVPHRKLEIDKKKSLTDKPGLEDNIIVHGDNLEALKSLMPHFAGKVKCIYIDPPYNTGNEGWIYNDKVNSPYHKEWLNKAVGIEDSNRHDKWLCMMMPRLKLLRELMTNDGVIFVSIDDIEHGNLRLIMDEIFGERSFIGNLTVISTTQPDNIGRARYGLQNNTEYVLAYSRCPVTDLPPFILRKLEQEKSYPHQGKFGKCRFEIIERAAEGAYARPTLQAFKILGQLPRKGKQWQIGEITARELEKAGKVELVDGIVKRAVYPEDDQAADAGLAPFWSFLKNAGTSQQGKAELTEILGSHGFETVKPNSLLREILMHIPKDSLILDSFAGSGTTAQAVLALNKEDGGNRKFILVEQLDYADKITAERVRRVIKGVKTAKDETLKKGLGGSFTYYELGESFDEEKFLSGKNLPSYKDMAGFVWETLTGNSIELKKINEKKQYIGETDEFEVYLIYEPDLERLKKDVALTFDWLKKLPEWDGKKKRLVFAPVKWMSSDVLYPFGVEYVQLPYEIYRRIEPK